MNDDEVLTEVRGRLEPARMTVPLDTVVDRGRARRRRRQILAAAEVTTAAAVAAGITVAAIGPGASRTSLAGWSVAVQGSELRVQMPEQPGPHRLQGTVSPAGLPVIVRMNPPGGGQKCAHPHTDIADGATATSGDGTYAEGNDQFQVRFDLHPSVIPAGDAVEIILITSVRTAGGSSSAAIASPGNQLVRADGSCLPS